MTAFIFIGDMLVMFFMIAIVVWMAMVDSKESIDYAASIPLQDEPEDLTDHG